MRKGILSMEEMDQPEVVETIEVDPNAVEQLDAHIGGVEENLGEADRAISELAEHDEGVAQAVETAETLDAIGDSVAETIPEGGMDERETRRLAIAVEHLYNQVNMPANRRVAIRASAEAYSTREARIIATQEAFDEIKANAKALGKKIIEAIKKIIEMAKAVFEKLFSATERQRARAAKLSKAAANMRGKSASGATEFKLPESAAVLKVNGKMLQGDALIHKFEEHIHNKAVARDYFHWWNVAQKDLAEIYKSGRVQADTISKLLLNVSSFADGKVIEVDGQMRSAVSLAFGNQELVLTYQKDRLDTMKAGIDGPALAAGGAEVKQLTVAQCEKLTDMVEEHLAKYKGTPGMLSQLANSLGALGDKFDLGQVGSKAYSSLMTTTQATRAATFGAGIAVRRYDAAVCKAILDVVATQLAAIGKTERVAGGQEMLTA